jgi:hypothetical protein
MAGQHFGKDHGRNPPENYGRFFVPAIGAPLATDLIRLATLRPGEPGNWLRREESWFWRAGTKSRAGSGAVLMEAYFKGK